MAEGIIDRVRRFLERNKIFFETVVAILLSITAILLSAMAIVISYGQYQTTLKQTSLIQKQTDIANAQQDFTIKQLDQQRKQTLLTKIQTDIANMQANLAKKQLRQQVKEAAISKARDWSMLRESLRPILERYPTLGTLDNPALKALSREEKIKWLYEMESMVSRLGTNPILIDSRHNYERYLAMLGDLTLAKTLLLYSDNQESNNTFYQVAMRTGEHAMRMWWDLGMQRSSRSPSDKIYEPSSPEESIFQKGFPWENEIRRKDTVQSISPSDKRH